MEELKAGLDSQQQEYSDDELKEVMKVADTDSDNKISRKEL